MKNHVWERNKIEGTLFVRSVESRQTGESSNTVIFRVVRQSVGGLDSYSSAQILDYITVAMGYTVNVINPHGI